jgi:hypothetical protein
MGNGGKGGTGNSSLSWLVIPYYSGDHGSRPLPSSDPFWACTSIKVDGSPYAGQLLQKNQTVELSLDAINYGTAAAPALCLFFWAVPTTSFTSANTNLIGQANLWQTSAGQVSQSLSPDALAMSTPPIPWTVPETVPAHICLVAMITTGGDPAPNIYNAAADRHFGQQNVQVMTAHPGQHVRVGFVMANGRATTGRFRLDVTHVLVNHHALRHLVAKDAVLRKAEQIKLRRIRSEASGNHHSLNVELGAGESLEVELSALVPLDSTPGSTIVLQLAQYQDRQHQPVGGLGVVVHVT